MAVWLYLGHCPDADSIGNYILVLQIQEVVIRTHLHISGAIKIDGVRDENRWEGAIKIKGVCD